MDSRLSLPPVSASAVCTTLLRSRFRGGLRRLSASAWEKKFEQQRQLWILLGEDLQDDGVRCDVCANADTTADDAIVLCDGCDVAVHQSCYLISEVPEGEWYCEYCAAKRRADDHMKRLKAVQQNKDLTVEQKEAELTALVAKAESSGTDIPCLSRRCVLCPRRGGALIRTTEGLWAHVSCGLWIPECWVVGCRSVCGVPLICASRFSVPCCICGLRGGASIQCAYEKCVTSFHAACAVMAGFGMNITDQINIQRKNNDVTFHPFCLRHRLCSHTRSVATDVPLEFRRSSPDFSSAAYQCAMLVRRNRDIILYTSQLQQEDSFWAARVSAYLLKELHDNIRCLRTLWSALEGPPTRRLHTKGVALPAGCGASESASSTGNSERKAEKRKQYGIAKQKPNKRPSTK
ncbi:E3 ubiquitin-protein ligase Jade-2 [Cyclospora cayetanensis]|uniref:E3 ubiquitin-protein ligase Jade-2 n=1 Tax=Cyclospora cayetanensis TaxID=88456 RepID=A0A6P6RZB1_9EIME|nr:E3 ubiquitin-protein ligase Jade-2 [Cyclospora cayetanensis]